MTCPDQLERRSVVAVLGLGVAQDGHHGGSSLRLPPDGAAAGRLLARLGVCGRPALPQVEGHPAIQQEESCNIYNILSVRVNSLLCMKNNNFVKLRELQRKENK